MSPKVHFISFASQVFLKSLHRIRNEAQNSGFFDSITCIRSSQLPLAYRFIHWRVLNRFRRGYGYWIWKSYIIKNKLKCRPDGDILVYLDAGYVIKKEGKKRFEEYLEIVSESDYSNLSFQTNHLEKRYTKADVFEYFKVQNNDYITESTQLNAGAFILRKNSMTISLIDEWYNVCHHKLTLINDSPSKYANDPNFIDHRNNQSVFSVLRKLRGTAMVPDETWFDNWEQNNSFPFHGKRLRK